MKRRPREVEKHRVRVSKKLKKNKEREREVGKRKIPEDLIFLGLMKFPFLYTLQEAEMHAIDLLPLMTRSMKTRNTISI